jgi:hypothetical protein
MRIYEVIFRNNDPVVHHRADPRLEIPTCQFDNDLSKLASAFTKHGVVKRFWYLNGSEDQPSEPAPPTAAGTELMPSDHLEPAITSREEPDATMALTQPNRLEPVVMKGPPLKDYAV